MSKKLLKECLRAFEYDNVIKVMTHLNWKRHSFETPRVPTKKDLKSAIKNRYENAKDLFDKDKDISSYYPCTSSSGGIEVTVDHGYVGVKFVVSDRDAIDESTEETCDDCGDYTTDGRCPCPVSSGMTQKHKELFDEECDGGSLVCDEEGCPIESEINESIVSTALELVKQYRLKSDVLQNCLYEIESLNKIEHVHGVVKNTLQRVALDQIIANSKI